MILLPRGNPVKEKLNPGKVNLPEALWKLHAGNFTGYLRFETSEGTGILIFSKGRLISALFEAERERLIAYDAIARLFDLSLSDKASLDIYRLSPELAISIHALLHGDVIYKGQDIRLIDIKTLLNQLKQERMTGCLRIYTREHVALIFYRNGAPLGFFHDGSKEIETTADASMSVARLPGAKIDVLSMQSSAEGVMADLLEARDLAELWRRAQEIVARRRASQEEALSRSREAQEKERREKILHLLRAAAERHVGKLGTSLVDKEYNRVLANYGSGPLSEAIFAGFYEKLGQTARLIAGPSAVTAMVEEMKRGVRTLLKNGS